MREPGGRSGPRTQPAGPSHHATRKLPRTTTVETARGAMLRKAPSASIGEIADCGPVAAAHDHAEPTHHPARKRVRRSGFKEAGALADRAAQARLARG